MTANEQQALGKTLWSIADQLRGAMNAVSQLSDDCAGVICCSTGNHGRGVAFAAARRGLRAVVCMSDMVPKAKV